MICTLPSSARARVISSTYSNSKPIGSPKAILEILILKGWSNLFKYKAVLEGQDDADSWTSTPLFTNIVVADGATSDDFEVAQGQDTAITVKSFIHQAKDSTGSDISAAEIQSAAETAFHIA